MYYNLIIFSLKLSLCLQQLVLFIRESKILTGLEFYFCFSRAVFFWSENSTTFLASCATILKDFNSSSIWKLKIAKNFFS